MDPNGNISFRRNKLIIQYLAKQTPFRMYIINSRNQKFRQEQSADFQFHLLFPENH